MTALSLLALVAATISAVLCVANLRALRPLPRRCFATDGILVSVLIPARDEAAKIGACVEAALASRGVRIEVIVIDDGSTDGTGEIVAAIAAREPKVRLLQAPPLPSGWAGKPHACHHLAQAAAGTHLLFIDADVDVARHAAATLAAYAVGHDAALVSGVPRQRMASLGELLTVPMINLLIYGYLPIDRMRATAWQALAAACGQMMLVERNAYVRTGGHAALRSSLHEGLQMARLFRSAGLRTDLVGGSELAACRMYGGFQEAWSGFAKNAREGMATPVALPVWTILLGCGHVLPIVLVAAGSASAVAVTALLLSLATRAAITVATREHPAAIVVHPFTVAVGLAIQWSALIGGLRGRPARWKGRVYQPGSAG